MRRWLVTVTPALLVVGIFGTARAHEGKDLPEGPIRDRHVLMEGIGKNAKVIGDALKAHDFSPVAEAAQKIQADASKAAALFPKDSTHPNSRAKPEIWTQWAKFEEGTKLLEAKAGALVTAAKDNGDVPAAGKELFGTCKGCHDQFRVPEKEKGKD